MHLNRLLLLLDSFSFIFFISFPITFFMNFFVFLNFFNDHCYVIYIFNYLLIIWKRLSCKCAKNRLIRVFKLNEFLNDFFNSCFRIVSSSALLDFNSMSSLTRNSLLDCLLFSFFLFHTNFFN